MRSPISAECNTFGSAADFEKKSVQSPDTSLLAPKFHTQQALNPCEEENQERKRKNQAAQQRSDMPKMANLVRDSLPRWTLNQVTSKMGADFNFGTFFLAQRPRGLSPAFLLFLSLSACLCARAKRDNTQRECGIVRVQKGREWGREMKVALLPFPCLRAGKCIF